MPQCLKQLVDGRIVLGSNCILHVSLHTFLFLNLISSISFEIPIYSYRKDVKVDQFNTPMSVADVGTPMSVDKTTIEEDQKTIKNDRDRFFDVCEYQNDIIKYLKSTEVAKDHFLINELLPKINNLLFLEPEKHSSRLHEEATRHH